MSFGRSTVLKDVNLDIGGAEFLVIVGPSGSGKTTILRLIGGFTEPTGGDILLHGISILGVPIFRRPFNTVFQDYALFPHLTVADNIAYGLKVRGEPRQEIGSRVAQTMEVVELQGLGNRYPAQLSGGQQQRVALARAIICRPRLVLLDEPLGALDAELRRRMQSFLKKLQQDLRITFLFITHDQEEAVSMADRVCVMRAGEIVQIGTPRDIYYRPVDEYVARFFGDSNLIDGRLGGHSGRGRAVETPIGLFHCAMDPEAASAAAGQPVKIIVRPEAIRPIAADEAADNRAEVRIEEVSFIGPSSHIRTRPLRQPDCGLALRVPSSASGPRFNPGDVIWIGWPTSDCRYVLL